MDYLALLVPLMSGVVAWLANEWRKRAADEYVRKEESYKALLRASRGFYSDTHDRSQKDEFLAQLNLCWLYCPDSVIRAAYAFLLTVESDAPTTVAERQRAFGAFVVALRRDLLGRRSVSTTSLTADDFQHYRATGA